MRKKDWLADVLLVVALVALVLAIVFLLMQGLADDMKTKELEEAQARNDLYRTDSIPAMKRPTDIAVAYEPSVPEENK